MHLTWTLWYKLIPSLYGILLSAERILAHQASIERTLRCIITLILCQKLLETCSHPSWGFGYIPIITSHKTCPCFFLASFVEFSEWFTFAPFAADMTVCFLLSVLSRPPRWEVHHVQCFALTLMPPKRNLYLCHLLLCWLLIPLAPEGLRPVRAVRSNSAGR